MFLLSRTGYRIVENGEDGTRMGPAGMELRGRGEWHQIDALVTPLYSLPFIYPLRLMVEAKCYAKERKTDVRIVRAAIGTALDVNQSYSKNGLGSDIEMQQFNYHAALPYFVELFEENQEPFGSGGRGSKGQRLKYSSTSLT
jgi:hypothetical protein